YRPLDCHSYQRKWYPSVHWKKSLIFTRCLIPLPVFQEMALMNWLWGQMVGLNSSVVPLRVALPAAALLLGELPREVLPLAVQLQVVPLPPAVLQATALLRFFHLLMQSGQELVAHKSRTIR